MELPKEIQNPFMQKGIPNRWVAILIPFLKQKECTKKEMLKIFGIDDSNWKTRRNSLNKPLTAMVQAGILDTANKGPATKWGRGSNFNAFVGFVMVELSSKHKQKTDLFNLLYQGDSANSLDFMKRLLLED